MRWPWRRDPPVLAVPFCPVHDSARVPIDEPLRAHPDDFDFDATAAALGERIATGSMHVVRADFDLADLRVAHDGQWPEYCSVLHCDECGRSVALRLNTFAPFVLYGVVADDLVETHDFHRSPRLIDTVPERPIRFGDDDSTRPVAP